MNATELSLQGWKETLQFMLIKLSSLTFIDANGLVERKS